MSVFAFTDGFVSVNGVDLSDHVAQISISTEAADLDDTAMGDTYHSRIGGLKDWSVTLQFHQDFAAGEVDATLFPLLGTTTAVIIRPDNSDGVSATNPNYSGSVLVNDYKPLDGSVGDLAGVSVTWPGAGTLTRATA
ncbi:MAG: radical SAM protein [Actinomycetota bacterium]